MELTKEYFDRQIKQFATKADIAKIHQELKGFVTKDYLDKKLTAFATKEYLDGKLSAFATKEYLDKKLATFATKDDLELLLGKMVDRVSDSVGTPLQRHIDQVKQVLILPEESQEEVAQPIMVSDKPQPALVFPNRFIEYWTKEFKRRWKEEKLPLAEQKKLLKVLLRPYDQSFRDRVLHSDL